MRLIGIVNHNRQSWFGTEQEQLEEKSNADKIRR